VRLRPRIAIITALGALTVVACGGSGGETTTTTGQAPPSVVASDGAGVTIADTELGAILVDSDGLTLYVFTPDDGGGSNCNGDCALIWPPVPGNTPIGAGVDASMFGTTTRDDGTEQLTVKGWPLYLFISDIAPGDTKGQGVEGVWFVVDADGDIVDGSGGQGRGSDTTSPDYDYGY
jgi:predicted lipoprotein with Yx(FWY)xxD motif